LKNDRSFCFYVLCLVLLLVPLALPGCRQRAVLDEKQAKNENKKLVVGEMITPGAKVIASPEIAQAHKLQGVIVAFLQAHGESLEIIGSPREHPVDFKDSNEAVSFALSELMAGPSSSEKAQGISSEIPKDTALIKVSADQGSGDITVDLSKQFIEGSGPDSFSLRLTQIIDTVENVAPGRKIYLNVEGQRLTASGEGLEVKQPINAVSD
jgi:spore germination protein GerM